MYERLPAEPKERKVGKLVLLRELDASSLDTIQQAVLSAGSLTRQLKAAMYDLARIADSPIKKELAEFMGRLSWLRVALKRSRNHLIDAVLEPMLGGKQGTLKVNLRSLFTADEINKINKKSLKHSVELRKVEDHFKQRRGNGSSRPVKQKVATFVGKVKMVQGLI